MYAQAKPEKWYAVRRGRVPGIYRTWLDASQQVTGFPEAEQFMMAVDNYPSRRSGGTSQVYQPQQAYQPAPQPEPSYTRVSTGPSFQPPQGQIPVPIPIRPNPGEYVIYTDGSYNQGTMGFAIYDPQQREVIYGPVLPYEGKISNNVAELMAIWYAIALFREVQTPLQKVMLTDSEYSMKTLTTYIPGWIHKYGPNPSSWKTAKGVLPENLNLINSIYQALPPDVRISHVRAHVGIHGNEMVDRYADMGRTQQVVNRVTLP